MANCVVALASEKLFKTVRVIVRFIEKMEPIPLLCESDANAAIAVGEGIAIGGYQHLRTDSTVGHALRTHQKAGQNVSKH